MREERRETPRGRQRSRNEAARGEPTLSGTVPPPKGRREERGEKREERRKKREETPKEAARGPQMRPPEVLKGEMEADRRLESLHFKG